MDLWIVSLIIGFALLLILVIGVPITFGLTGLSVVLLLIFRDADALYLIIAATLKQMSTDIFIAVPLFILMATILQFSGVAGDLYESMHKWVGPVKGGLASGTVVICTIIAAISGVAATATTTMGLIALPEMHKRGYYMPIVLGAIAGGGALGVLIPPSVLMIIVGGYSGVSVGKLFIGGILPGILVSLSWVIYITIRCAIRKMEGPALPEEERGTLWEKIVSLRALVLPFLVIALVLGEIYGGICTPTEAASFGVFGALVCAAVNRKLRWSNMSQALITAARITGMVMWLVIGGGCYSVLISSTGVGAFVSNVLTGLPTGPSGVVLIMLGVVFVMGMFIDPVAISMICIPIFMPAILRLGIDPLWSMLLFTICVIVGYITPPFGINLFYMKGVAPEETTMMDIYRGAVPYALLMVIVLVFCFKFPSLLIWLPNTMIK